MNHRTAADILQFIQDRAGPYGIEIAKYSQAKGTEYWMVRGAGVNAGGYPSFTAAIHGWCDAVEYLESEDKDAKVKE